MRRTHRVCSVKRENSLRAGMCKNREETAMRHVQFMQKLCRGIALVGQLGFSLITPPVVLLWLAHWLQTKYQLGVWVTIVDVYKRPVQRDIFTMNMLPQKRLQILSERVT